MTHLGYELKKDGTVVYTKKELDSFKWYPRIAIVLGVGLAYLIWGRK